MMGWGEFELAQNLTEEKIKYVLRVSEQERLIREALPPAKSRGWRRALMAAKSVFTARRQSLATETCLVCECLVEGKSSSRVTA